MKVRKTLIVEDNLQARELLQEFISQLPFFAAPDICQRAEDALLLLSEKNYDLVFLDIELPGLSGIELLQSLGERYPVIITTSHPGFALESYDLDIIDYLIKPVSFPRFVRAVKRAFRSENQQAGLQDEIFLKVGRKLQLFKYREIDYIEADGAFCKIWQDKKFTLITDTISNLLEQLPGQYFIRVHKSFVINISKLTAYDYRTVWLKETKIPIGEMYRKSFQGSIGDLSG